MSITNAQLAEALNDLIVYLNDREVMFEQWITGAAGGGPNDDGRYPLKSRLGATWLAKSPLQLQADYEAAIDDLESNAEAIEALADAVSDNATAVASYAAQVAADLESVVTNRIASEAARSGAENAAANIYAMLQELEGWGVNKIYDIMIFVGGTPTESEVVSRLVVGRGFAILSGAPGSRASAASAPTDEYVLSLQHNDEEFGTITFDEGETDGVISVPSLVPFDVDDVFTVVAPEVPDVTVGNISITLIGQR
jgi:hypothetical protein